MPDQINKDAVEETNENVDGAHNEAHTNNDSVNASRDDAKKARKERKRRKAMTNVS